MPNIYRSIITAQGKINPADFDISKDDSLDSERFSRGSQIRAQSQDQMKRRSRLSVISQEGIQLEEEELAEELPEEDGDGE